MRDPNEEIPRLLQRLSNVTRILALHVAPYEDRGSKRVTSNE
jgi:hypothetical protein